MTGLARVVCAASMITSLAAAASVKLERRDSRIDVSVDSKPFTVYYFDSAVAKPYLMPLRTASGVILSRSFPVGNNIPKADVKSPSFEPHQRPLYFAHGDIDGLDFWSEKAFSSYYGRHDKTSYGHMVLDKIEEGGGSIHAVFHLVGPDGRILGDETQTFTFGSDAGVRTIDCEFVIEATHGPVVMGDTKEGTFGIRLRQELSAPHDNMTNSAGAHGEPAIWGKPANWVNYSGTVDGKRVGIAAFDHPQSFRHPTTWHARAYGLLAANPFGLREFTNDPQKDGSWTIPGGKSLTFRYRVVLYDGTMSSSQIESAYQKYAAGR